MNLTPLLIQAEKHYKLTCDKSVDECIALLQEICAAKRDKTKPLVGTVDATGFNVRRRTWFGAQLFQTCIKGTFSKRESGTGVEIPLVPSLNSTGSSAINAPANCIFGAVIGVIICNMFVQDAVAVSYAFLYMVMIPAVIMFFVAISATLSVSDDSTKIVGILEKQLGASKTPVPSQKAKFKQVLWGESFALIIGTVLFVGFSYFLHTFVWGLWCRGEYLNVEAFCRPVYDCTRTLFGESSGAASDCRFLLAESLRCRAKSKEASWLYQKSIDLFDAKQNGRVAFVADNKFGLARIEDQSGRHADAEHLYKEAIEGWTQSKQIGPKSIWVSRALDRLAMLYLKEGKYADAQDAMQKALNIDRALGKETGRSVGEDLNDDALIFDKQEQYDQASKLYEEALREKERVLGKNHYSLGTTLFNLSDIRKLQHRAKESDELADRASKIWSASLGHGNYLDPYREYMEIMLRTRSEYEVPFADTRFDGLRPYLGRT
jgi:tetratricopeptide (TPR) repeat protein